MTFLGYFGHCLFEKVLLLATDHLGLKLLDQNIMRCNPWMYALTLIL